MVYVPGMEIVIRDVLILAVIAVGLWYVSRKVIRKLRAKRRSNRLSGDQD